MSEKGWFYCIGWITAGIAGLIIADRKGAVAALFAYCSLHAMICSIKGRT